MMNDMECKICSRKAFYVFDTIILGKYQINYYQCVCCKFIQTEEPYWLEEAYASPINVSDTGYMARNLAISKKLTVILYSLFKTKGSFLDYAAGYGVLVRLMRDTGFNFYWEDKYTDNLFAREFEWDNSLKVDAVTAFEVFEHFLNPIEEIDRLISISDTLIFSTELYPDYMPKPEEWWYFGLDHGQHISFYSRETIEFLARKYQLNYYTDGFIHILTKKKLSKYILISSKYSSFGLSKLVAKFLLNSKTFTDFEQVSNLK